MSLNLLAIAGVSFQVIFSTAMTGMLVMSAESVSPSVPRDHVVMYYTT